MIRFAAPSDLPQVLGADLLQGVFGKLGDIFLGGGAVLEDHVAVGDVNGPGKVLTAFRWAGESLASSRSLSGKCASAGGVLAAAGAGAAAACPWPARGELGFSVSSGMNSSAMKPVLS